MDETDKVEQYLKDLLTVMVSRAEKEVDAVMPGYTHLQVSHTSPAPSRPDNSELNPFDGRISSYLTPKPSSPICLACDNSSLESRSSLSVRQHSQEIHTVSTENFFAPNSVSNLSERTLCTPSRTVTSLLNGCNGQV